MNQAKILPTGDRSKRETFSMLYLWIRLNAQLKSLTQRAKFFVSSRLQGCQRTLLWLYAWIRLLCIMGFRWSTTLFREVIYRIYRYLFPPTPEPRILPAGYTFDLGGVKFGEPYIEDLAIKFPIEGTGLVKDMTIKYLDTVVHVTRFAHRLPVCFGDIVTVGPMWMPLFGVKSDEDHRRAQWRLERNIVGYGSIRQRQLTAEERMVR